MALNLQIVFPAVKRIYPLFDKIACTPVKAAWGDGTARFGQSALKMQKNPNEIIEPL